MLMSKRSIIHSINWFPIIAQSIEIMKKLWVQYDGLIDIMFELKDKKELEEVNELSRSQSTLIIIVEIIDYGLGIPESPKDKLFTCSIEWIIAIVVKLVEVIVKEIVEAHQGEIRYESVLGEGSTFTVRLNRLENGSDYE